MATTSGDENEGRMHVGEAARELVENMRVVVTGSAFVSLRSLLLLITAGVCMSVAPFPAATIGFAAICLLAFEWGRRIKT